MPDDAARPRTARPEVMGPVLTVGPALAAGVVAGAAGLGRGPLVAAVVVVQVAIALAWVAVVGIPAAAGAVAIVLAAAIAADVYVDRDDTLTAVAGVIAASFVAALLMQLARRQRRRVTTSLAGVMSGVVLAVLTTYLLAIDAGDAGRRGAVIVAVAVATVLLVGRLVQALPLGVPGLGWIGLVVSVVAASGAGALLGNSADPLTVGSGTVIALASALAAGLADIAVAVSSAEVGDGRRLLAAGVLAVVLPLAAAAPAGYAATTIAVG